MNFTFSEDQLLFQESVRDFLVNEVTAERIRESWENDSGRSAELWAQITELGLPAMTIAEQYGGLGMTALDFVLLAQECGYVGLPEPLVHQVLVASPVLAAIGGALADEWLPRIAAGDAKVMVCPAENLLVEDAHIADLLILQSDDELHALKSANVTLTYNESVDPSRKLYAVTWQACAETLVAKGSETVDITNLAINGGALGAAAEMLGLAQRMVDMSVQYTSERQQFGKAIGSFQAVKHHMANIAYKLEYAKGPLYRAAYSLANKADDTDTHISHAKIAASDVAKTAAQNCMQVHGAMGYTWEVDLHIFMKKAWALPNTWGDVAFHKTRVAQFVFNPAAEIGAANTF